MLNTDVKSLILNDKLAEENVTIPAWNDAKLFIRELSGKAGTALLASCSDENGKVVQDKLVAGIILSTLRNPDESGKLVFALADKDEPDNAYADMLMSEVGLGKIMQVAQASIKLSGLDAASEIDTAKNA